VHEAITQRNPLISERIQDAMTQCNIPGHAVASILFGAEKNGAVNLIQTASELLTDDSRLLYGTK
jgi:hypothetical protein